MLIDIFFQKIQSFPHVLKIWIENDEPFWAWFDKEKIFWANQKFWRIIGFTGDKQKASDSLESSNYWAALRSMIFSSSQPEIHTEIKFTNDSGVLIPFSTCIQKFIAPNGEQIGFWGKSSLRDASSGYQKMVSLFAKIQNLARIGIWELDFENKRVDIAWFNDSDEQKNSFKQIDLEEALSYYDSFHREMIELKLKNSFDKHEPLDLVLTYLTSKSTVRTLKIQGFPWFDSDKFNKLIGFYQDITTQSQEQDMIKAIFEGFNGVVWSMSWPKKEPHFISDNVNRILGFSREEWLQNPDVLFDCLNPHDREIVGTFFEILLKEGYVELSYRIIKPDGKEIWVNSKATLYYYNGVPIRIDGICQDISHMVNVEQQFIRTKKLLESVAKIIKIGAWKNDYLVGNVEWSDVMREILEVDPHFVPDIHNSLLFFKEGEHRNKMKSALIETEKTGLPFDIEAQIITQKGNQRWVRVIAEAKTAGSKVIEIFGAFHDISEQKSLLTQLERKNEDLKQIQTKLQSILDSTTDINILLDADQRILNYNKSAALSIKAAFGREPVLGDDFRDFTFPQFWGIFAENFNTALSGSIFSCEYDIQIVEGTYWFNFQFYPVYNSENQVIGVTLNITDIDEKKKAIQKLQEKNIELNQIIGELKQANEKILKNDEILRGLIESQTTYLLRTDLEGNYTYINEQYRKDFASDSNVDGLIGENSMLSVDEGYHQLLIDSMKALSINPKSIVKLTLCKKTIDGRKIYNFWEFTGITDSDGKLKEIQCIGFDITERILAEQSLKESELYYRSLFNSIPESIFVLNHEGICLDYKPDSYSSEENSGKYVGKNIKDILPIEACKSILNSAQEIQIENEPKEFQYHINKKGAIRYYKARLASFGSEKTIMIVADITDSVDNLKHIESLLEVKERQNQRLVSFTHVVSHNLRSHTANITGLLNLFESEFPEFYADNQYLKLLKTSSERLNETIYYLNQILDLEKTQKENYQLVDLEEMVKAIINSLYVFAYDNKVNVITEIETGLKINTVPAYIESITLNFLTNSIKYSSVERESYAKIKAYSSHDAVVMVFEDNGLGIDLELHGDKLFGMYKTFHSNSDAKGIGLFLTKNQVDALGGKIEVKSQVDVGTVFKVTFPQ